MELLRGDQGGKGKFESYPVVAGFDGMAFIGTISRKNLVGLLLIICYLGCLIRPGGNDDR